MIYLSPDVRMPRDPEVCDAETEPDDLVVSCGLPPGHDGPHRCVIEWEQ